ncbi:sensor histidine kinase [Pseudoalteromonas luteoviolacea]|uniref:sensor histidine kinase n=1 Tax=Pseudoalteromonas luteoviolacea TaxID=43657 RepID=UPI001B380878|nr:HAMP domain-containing sensor histidine kinase [Pseudoalteromonas luteoviolacea]MBQ4837244.1 HAMP domain-containing histidine kinase [Pseudoalteromonas luteoviolacea]
MKLKYLLFIIFFPLMVLGPAAVGFIAYQFIEQTTFEKLTLLNDMHTTDFIGLHVESRNQTLIKNKLDSYPSYVNAYKKEVLLEVKQSYEHYDGSFLIFDKTLDKWFYKEGYLKGESKTHLSAIGFDVLDGVNVVKIGAEQYIYSKHVFSPWEWEIYGIYPLSKASGLLYEIGFAVFWVCAFILMLLFVITSFIYRYLFLNPLTKITQFSENVSMLKLDNKLVIESPTEFAVLSHSLETMRVKLNDNLEKIEAANEDLSEFSYRTSHDLKSPLTASKQLAKYVLEDIKSGNLQEATSSVERIFNQMSKLESLVDDVLSLTRVDLVTERDEFLDVHDLLSEVKAKIDTFFHTEECVLTMKVDMDDPKIFGQRVRYKQIIENLVSNSFKYKDAAKKQCFVTVTLKDNDHDGIMLEVEDNGVGIPKTYHHEVYDMFKRFHPQLSSGSGLGLAIVKKHVDKLKGYINFDTSDQGTRFTIHIKRNK